MKAVLTLTKSLIVACAIAFVGNAQAQTSAPAAAYPAKPIRLVVPFPAGGATDAIARIIAQKLSENWHQQVIVENRAGATGAVGSEFVARAPADGYTILMGTASTHSVAPAVNPKLSYKNISEFFTPVALVATFPNMLVVHPSVPAKNIPEFIALLKSNPNKYNFASTGTGGSVHLAGELFKLMTGTQMVHIPYKGSSEALKDLLSGEVQVEFDNMTTVWPHVQTGKLRALGVASLERTQIAPNVPTIAETVPNFEANSWVGFFVPARTPGEIVEKISAETRRALQSPDVVQTLQKLGATPVGSQPGAFAGYVKKDTERWRKVVNEAAIKVE